MTQYQMNEHGRLDVLQATPTAVNNRLFVYGIFLGETMRKNYGMSNPKYATVPGYATFGYHIVQAAYIGGDINLALTGLTVDVDPDKWQSIDALEGGYDRILVKTESGEEVNMYVAPERQRSER